MDSFSIDIVLVVPMTQTIARPCRIRLFATLAPKQNKMRMFGPLVSTGCWFVQGHDNVGIGKPRPIFDTKSVAFPPFLLKNGSHTS